MTEEEVQALVREFAALTVNAHHHACMEALEKFRRQFDGFGDEAVFISYLSASVRATLLVGFCASMEHNGLDDKEMRLLLVEMERFEQECVVDARAQLAQGKGEVWPTKPDQTMGRG